MFNKKIDKHLHTLHSIQSCSVDRSDAKLNSTKWANHKITRADPALSKVK